jgi:acetyl-CoA acetyltransferase
VIGSILGVGTSLIGGRFERVLAVGLEKMTDRFVGPIVSEHTDTEGRARLALPALYAMAAFRYLAVHDVTEPDLACVAVKNYAHGSLELWSQGVRPRVWATSSRLGRSRTR